MAARIMNPPSLVLRPARRAAPAWVSAAAEPRLAIDAALLALTALCMFHGLGVGPIRDTDEALYADIAAAMAHGGSWIIPHLDGVPYIEKPPLLYWIMALVFKAFGVGAWQARLPDALAGWLCSVGCVALGRITGAPLAGRFAALVTATSLGFLLVCRTVLFDPVMALFWLAAFACVQLAMHRQQRSWLRAAAVAVGLATLAKGPMALALLGLVGLLQIVFAPEGRARSQWLRFLLDPWSVALFLLIVAPWHIAASLRLPGFAHFYFVNETLMRFLGTRVPRDFHTGPWWYYGPRLLIGFFQWSGVMAAVALLAPRLRGSGTAEFTARMARNAALVWIVFFSAAGDKGAYYLLPTVPLLAWWLGVRLQAAQEASASARLRTWIAMGMLGFALCTLGALALSWTPELQAAILRSGLPAGELEALRTLLAELSAASLLAGVLQMRGRGSAALLLFGLLGLAMAGFADRLSQAKTADLSQRHVAAKLYARMPADTIVYSWRRFEDHDASLLLYGTRQLRVIDSLSSDLRFGCAAAPDAGACVGPGAVLRSRAEGRPLAVWVPRGRLAGFLATGLAAGMFSFPARDSVVFYLPERSTGDPTGPWLCSQSRKASFMRDCHPSPLARKASITSAS
ncbi:MAG: glycosyltransferase family 39 protein [Betaproteobacteria bacterium]|nr:glycosyltransferase family 39 protein [Betaproteobacteria bacterium]